MGMVMRVERRVIGFAGEGGRKRVEGKCNENPPA